MRTRMKYLLSMFPFIQCILLTPESGYDVSDERSVHRFRDLLTEIDGQISSDNFLEALWERFGMLPGIWSVSDEDILDRSDRGLSGVYIWKTIYFPRLLEEVIDKENTRLERSGKSSQRAAHFELKKLFEEVFPKKIASVMKYA